MSQMKELIRDNLLVSKLIKGNFHEVHRIEAKTSIYNLEMILDFHSGLFPMKEGSTYSFSIIQDKHQTEQYYEDKNTETKQEFDDWDYVVFGTVFDVKETADNNV